MRNVACFLASASSLVQTVSRAGSATCRPASASTDSDEGASGCDMSSFETPPPSGPTGSGVDQADGNELGPFGHEPSRHIVDIQTGHAAKDVDLAGPRRVVVHHALRPSCWRARLSSSTLTLGSPKRPRVLPSVCSLMISST